MSNVNIRKALRQFVFEMFTRRAKEVNMKIIIEVARTSESSNSDNFKNLSVMAQIRSFLSFKNAFYEILRQISITW